MQLQAVPARHMQDKDAIVVDEVSLNYLHGP